jgi:hypothetical protein
LFKNMHRHLFRYLRRATSHSRMLSVGEEQGGTARRAMTLRSGRYPRSVSALGERGPALTAARGARPSCVERLQAVRRA